jgi:hypothetical protein
VPLEFHKAIMIEPSPHKMQMKSERHCSFGSEGLLGGWLVRVCCLIDFICPPAPEEAGGTKERSWWIGDRLLTGGVIINLRTSAF